MLLTLLLCLPPPDIAGTWTVNDSWVWYVERCGQTYTVSCYTQTGVSMNTCGYLIRTGWGTWREHWWGTFAPGARGVKSDACWQIDKHGDLWVNGYRLVRR